MAHPVAEEAVRAYQELLGAPGVVARGVFLGVLALMSVLERMQYQLHQSESSHWWASNGRDVINGFGLLACTLGLHLLGFGGPVSLLIAGTLIICLNALQAPLEATRHGTLGSFTLAFLLGVPVMAMPQTVDRVVRLAFSALF